MPVYGPIEQVEFNTLEDMQELVGGYIEPVPWVFRGEPMLYVNEEGKYKCRPNRTVTLDGDIQDILFGPILACGFDYESGEDVDITEDEIKVVHETFGFNYPTNPDGYGSGYAAYCDFLRLVDFDAD